MGQKPELLRRQVRRVFTITCNELKALAVDYSDSFDIKRLKFLMASLEDKAQRLFAYDFEVAALLPSDSDESTVQNEFDSSEKYREELSEVRILFQSRIEVIERLNQVENDIDRLSVRSHLSNSPLHKKYRYPQLEFLKFDGKAKNWIGFWGLFKKVHEDETMDKTDKFQFLLQQMVIDSDAWRLVKSYPPSANNYDKAIEQLKSRFARDEVLIEVYVRELLNLVLDQTKSGKQTQLSYLYDKLVTQIRALESLGVTSDKFAAMLYPLVESAIPDETLLAWERSRVGSSMRDSNHSLDGSSYDTDRLTLFLDFLKLEVEHEERLNLAKSGFGLEGKGLAIDKKNTPSASALVSISSPTEVNDISVSKSQPSNITSKENSNCLFCHLNNHTSSECSSAMDMTLIQKNEIVKKKGACFKCLKLYHLSNKCRTFVKCILCRKAHYAIMCPLTENITDKNRQESDTKALCTQSSCYTTYLQTLVVKIVNKGQEFQARVLLDSGSQKSYILKNLARDLQLQRQSKVLVRQELFGGQKTTIKSHCKYEITICSMTDSSQCTLTVLDQDKICGFVPKVNNSSIIKLLENKGIVLSDSSVNSPEIEEIHLLLGADSWPLLFTNDTVPLNERLLAMRTTLGWTVIGSTNEEERIAPALLNVLTCHVNLSDFWDLELLGIEDPGATIKQAEKDKEVEAFFRKTIARGEDGRYIVQLPWIQGIPALEDNKDVAKKRLIITTRKLKAINRFGEYDKVINLWLKLGIVEEVHSDELKDPAFYLPHRAVIKEYSTTPVRPVFDASCLDKNGRSLNTCIEKGPNLIALIVSIIVNFRLYPLALTADIEKAFLQIKISEKDRNQLRFLWWAGEHIQVLRHSRVVFGVSSSPYLLGAVLKYHLENAPTELKNTALKLIRSFYVDNLVTGADSEEDLTSLRMEAELLLSSAGFNLRGWVSNAWNIEETQVVLGMMWTCKSDELSCNIKLVDSVPTSFTRRTLLSIAQRLYDPLGFLTPASITPRALLQRSWDKKQSWDNLLPEDIQQEFKHWLTQVDLLKDCKIPRYIPLSNASTIHVFCDASKMAYACCIFVRTEVDRKIIIRLLIAKSRIAPTKALTLPRLELMAALVGVRLYNEAVKDTSLLNCSAYFWTDASTVIAWISRQTQWSVFVDNRVREIRKTCDNWRHVPGIINPADLLSRGCTPKQLINSQWWEGPSWLHLPQSEWPQSNVKEDESEVLTEVRKTVLAAPVTESMIFAFSDVIDRCGKFSTIIRVMARILDAVCTICPRFAQYCGLSEEIIMNKDINSEKYLNSEMIVFRIVQQECFTGDQKKIMQKKFDTFCDERGLIRMKTRLLKGNFPKNFQCPIILPGKHSLTHKLIIHEHLVHKHAGALTLMTILRERFWIFHFRRTVRRIINKCVVCKRHVAKSLTAPEPSLPLHRISTGNVFQSTGVDLAGPLFLASGEKCWIILFTCCVYRAVHLDLLLSLSSAALIQALRRFIARRGRPTIIQSDNGSNFTGLENLFSQLNWEEIQEECGLQRIIWKFNPPSAAWWGGYWERLVRIMKDLLKRNLGQASLLQDEMYTLLCECESIMNSRPLTYISEEPNEVIPLTPATFLNNLIGMGVTDLDNIEENSLNKRYKYLQDVRQGLRNRFTREYLAFLRTARRNREDNIKVGEIVLIGSEKKRIFWPLGRVIELLPGADGIVRLVKLWTAKGELLRPIQKLYPLEIDLQIIPTHNEVDQSVATSQPEEFDLHNESSNSDVSNQLGDSFNPTDATNETNVSDLTEEDDMASQGDHKIQEPSLRITRTGRLVKPKNILNL